MGLNFVPVQQQSNGSDCGVFAIAFTTCLVLESDPRQVTFDVNGIRHRLASCLRNRAISMFPCLRFFEASAFQNSEQFALLVYKKQISVIT